MIFILDQLIFHLKTDPNRTANTPSVSYEIIDQTKQKNKKLGSCDSSNIDPYFLFLTFFLHSCCN